MPFEKYDPFITAAQWLAKASHVVVFTGAGISKASGVPTYRDADGLWQSSSPFSTLSGYKANPEQAQAFWAALYAQMSGATPNPAHLALADSQDMWLGLDIVTQNVDGLHQRAGNSRVMELHGTISKWQCLKRKDHISGEGHTCAQCSGPMRPAVVLFEERLSQPVFNKAFRAVQQADVLLVIGTSADVSPAASLISEAIGSQVRVIVVDPNPPAINSYAPVKLRMPAEVGVPALMAAARAYQQLPK